MSKNPYQKYKESAVLSASKETLLLMMYEAAIKFTKKALTATEAKDIAGRGENIGHAYDVINELNNTLDHKVGGKIAEDLERLYNFMTDQLVQANVKADSEKLRSVIRILETLYEGWRGAIEKLKTERQVSGGKSE